MNEFKVTIDTFDGPLDLMLHLIKEKQLDLMNLDMNVLTDQYIAYLNQMENLHLEIASEYLSELATLIEYKSKKMLPGKHEDLDDSYEEDPKDRLVKRLLEYQQFKEASEDLNALYESRQLQLSRPLSDEVDQWMKEDESLPYEGNPYDLMRAMLDRLPKTFRFENLLEDVHDMPMFIATFLSVLDLARQHTLAFTVDENDVIWFTRGGNAE